MADRVTSEIFPIYGAPVQLVTDNGPENVNKVMIEALASLNIVHITTTPYHPQGNAKVRDVLAKLARITLGIGTCI